MRPSQSSAGVLTAWESGPIAIAATTRRAARSQRRRRPGLATGAGAGLGSGSGAELGECAGNPPRINPSFAARARRFTILITHAARPSAHGTSTAAAIAGRRSGTPKRCEAANSDPATAAVPSR